MKADKSHPMNIPKSLLDFCFQRAGRAQQAPSAQPSASPLPVASASPAVAKPRPTPVPIPDNVEVIHDVVPGPAGTGRCMRRLPGRRTRRQDSCGCDLGARRWMVRRLAQGQSGDLPGGEGIFHGERGVPPERRGALAGADRGLQARGTLAAGKCRDVSCGPEPHRMLGRERRRHLVACLGTMGDQPEFEGSGGYPGVSSKVQAVADFCGPTDLTARMWSRRFPRSW